MDRHAHFSQNIIHFYTMVTCVRGWVPHFILPFLSFSENHALFLSWLHSK